jgi:hypothetical protein
MIGDGRGLGEFRALHTSGSTRLRITLEMRPSLCFRLLFFYFFFLLLAAPIVVHNAHF